MSSALYGGHHRCCCPVLAPQTRPRTPASSSHQAQTLQVRGGASFLATRCKDGRGDPGTAAYSAPVSTKSGDSYSCPDRAVPFFAVLTTKTAGAKVLNRCSCAEAVL